MLFCHDSVKEAKYVEAELMGVASLLAELGVASLFGRASCWAIGSRPIGHDL